MAADKRNTTGSLIVNVAGLVRATPEEVFDAWIEPDIRRQWWLNVRGEGPTVCEIDARVGGGYRIHQIGSGSESADPTDTFEWIMTGEFLEVSRPERLAFTWNVNNPDEPVVDERVTVSFRAVADGTMVEILHEGIRSARLRDGTDAGWTKMLEQIDDVVGRA